MSGPKLICEKCTRDGSGHFCCPVCGARVVSRTAVDTLLAGPQKIAREQYIEEVRQTIQQHQAALVLGAGISVPCGMPQWSGLISNMMGYAIQYDLAGPQGNGGLTREASERDALLRLTQEMLRTDKYALRLLGNVNTLEAAEYVAQMFVNRFPDPNLCRSIEEDAIATMVGHLVDDSLTPDAWMKKHFPGTASKRRSESSLSEVVDGLGRRKVAEKSTMPAVAYLLCAEEGVRQAMTYNYDPLVQEYMRELFPADKLQVVTHPGMWNQAASSAGEKREIFHVHGFAPGKRHLGEEDDVTYPRQSGPLVLSEDSYYRIEREETYSWSSSIQSFFFNRYSCLFVGFSAEDYNFRRILRQMGENPWVNHPPHYLILPIDNWVEEIYQSVCSSRFKRAEAAKDVLDQRAINQINTDSVLLLQYFLRCRERYWLRFRIRPIWVLVQEIPSLLTSLLDHKSKPPAKPEA